MTTSSIAGDIHAFIRDQILSGQDDGLTATTPLLELGILDSFGLFKLISHLNELYGIELKAENVSGRDFRNIEAIVALVAQQRATASPSSPPADKQPEGVAVFEAPGCAQAFIMFTGLGGVGMPGRVFAGAAKELVEDSALFFKRANLHDRNMVLFHDARGRSYKEGVSSDLPSREAILAWLQAWLSARPHIEEVYCIGVSAGGPMGMLAGDVLQARTVWAFAPRTARGNLSRQMHEELAQLVQRVTGKSMRELQHGLAPEDEAKIDALVTPAMVEEYYACLLDPGRVLDFDHLAEVVETLSRGNGATRHRIYYVPRDACDALVADALKDCPGVTLVPVEPSEAPPPQWAFSRWIPPERWICRNHLVVDLLRERGVFGTLFPPVRLAAVASATT